MSKKIKLKIKKTHPLAVLPKYAHEGDACMDVTAVSMNFIDTPEFGFIEYGLGLAFDIPKGYVLEIYPRSSISNTGLILANSPAQIDSSFKSEVKLRFKWVRGTKHYDIGDRIGQMKLVPYPEIEIIEVDDVGDSTRGSGAFGSTGK